MLIGPGSKGHPVDTVSPADRPPELAALFRVVARELGVRLEDYRQTGINRRLANRIKLVGCAGIPDYLDLLERNPAECRRLLEYLTIKWSGFFRDPRVFERLKSDLLPALLASRGEDVTIWSAGCGMG